jgi:DNA polymerase I-like protein with 3'-5' exonuclease and polymerase domains
MTSEFDKVDAFIDSLEPSVEVQSKKATSKKQTPRTQAQIDFLEALEKSKKTNSSDTISKTPPQVSENKKLDDATTFMEKSGLQRERSVPDIKYPWMEHHKFTLVTTVTEVNHIVDECIKSGFCALDLETEGLDNRIEWKNGKPETIHKIVGYCISYDGIEGFYIPVRHRPKDGGPDLNIDNKSVEAAITRLCHAAIPEGTPEAIKKDPLSYKCEKPALIIAFWNAQFDQEFLFPVTGIDWWHPESFEDGMLAAFTKYAGDKYLGLKRKAVELLQDINGNPYEMIELKQLFFGKTKAIKFQTLAPDEVGVLRYTGSDAICTYKLCQILVPICHEKHELTYRIEKQTSNVVRVMERNRVRINRKAARETLEEQTKKRQDLLSKIQNFAKQRNVPNLDPNSPKQLSAFLFEPTGLNITPKPEKNEASKQYKTDAETLEGLAKRPNAPPILKDIVAFREVEKFISTYLDGLANNPDQNDELRFSFKQTGAASGRFSAPAGMSDHGYSGIPIHGIPRGSEIRRVFEARPGYTMVKADYAGEELRIAANISGEIVWINEFLQGSGDLHSITARAFFGKQEVSKDERNAGKTANFALLYGGGSQAVMRATGCNEIEGHRRKAAFDRAVPIYAEWVKGQHQRVKKDLGVFTAFGRWLPIPDANSKEKKVQAACERYSTNYVIQGSGADIMKISMIFLHKAFHRRGWLKNGGDDSVRMLLTVHDEVVFEIRHERVAEAIPVIVDLMEYPWRMPKTPLWKVPLVVEPLAGLNWASGYDIKRVTKDYAPAKGEIVINGFAYSTTRKPRTNAKGEIIESLDQNESRSGKVFHIANPPWLMGQEPKEDFESEEQEPLPTPSVPEVVPEIETEPAEVFTVNINQLNGQTAEQIANFVSECFDKNGSVLHLTDIVGTTLIPSTSKLRVDKNALITKLRQHNLLCLEAQDAVEEN